MFGLTLVILLATVFIELSHSVITCIGQDGNPVDWFIAYKMPRIEKGPSSNFRRGVGLVYMDARSPEWVALDASVTDTRQPLYYTLKQIYDMANRNSNKMYLMYNDQTPYNKQSSSKAHAKGDVAFDSESGFWLVHSVPAFPPTETYSYPSSGTYNGQIFMCITFPTSQMDIIGAQLQINNPLNYSSVMSSDMRQISSEMASFIDGKRVYRNKKTKTAEHFKSIKKLKSVGKKTVVSFAKGKYFAGDLYQDFISSSLNSSLLVQTWLKGDGDLPSDCSGSYSIKNIKSLNMIGMGFESMTDHSKWAISDGSQTSKRWVCVGDINRQDSQKSRGGGALCISDARVWRSFMGLVKTLEGCKE